MKVASIMGSNKIYPLRQLEHDQCWQLFAKHAFQDNYHQSSRDCEEIGMKIVEKCKGLPLALTTVGSLLHQKSTVSEWECILKSEIWEFSEEDSDILPALRLSYHHLPPHLKRCFAYCALFPKDYMFDKKFLIQLWMTENFLQCHQRSKSLEVVGEEYFNDLLSRSFFQQSSFSDETCFFMHDLLSDLAKYVSGDFCFRLEVCQAKNIPQITRHFSIAISQFHGFGTLHDTRRFRTFFPTREGMNFIHRDWYCKMALHELFSKRKFLRVLSLSHCYNLYVVPDSVGNLKLLRSLDLSNTNIKNLSNSTCSLYNLQILKLNCIRSMELPSNLHKLTNLHRLELIKTKVRKVPFHMGKLKNLQVLMSSFVVGKGRQFSIQPLGELNLKGGLSIEKLQKVENSSDAIAMDLKNKTQLVELELKWDRDQEVGDSMEEKNDIVIENLQPSKQLEKLSINNYGGKQFPRWLSDNSLLNMVSLTLMNCQSCQYLPSLGLLPFLKHLTIEGFDGVVSIDSDFYGSSSCSFTSLETLRLYSMIAWEKWECRAVTGAFPRLQYLRLDRCPKLKGHLPMQVALLKTLYITCCEQLLGNNGGLQSDGKNLDIVGHEMETWLVELIGRMISCTSHDYMHISYSPNMNIPMSPCYNFLVTLKIHDTCDSLTTFTLDLFPALQLLSLYGCKNLQRISQGHGVGHNHLKDLTIWKCPQFESLPEGMHILPSLYKLTIRDCPKHELFPNGGLPSNLETMDLNNCSKLITSMKGSLGANPTLETLWIGKLGTESFPDEGLLPHSLNCLWIIDCPNLKKLDYKGLCHLSSRETMVLQNCPSLQCLPEDLCNLPSLEKLVVQECRSLQCLPEGLRHLSSLKKLVLQNCPVSDV
ncbi:hypothetical protein Fmac_025544 [Flemingia macrophylla]|uniref:NB-ARC domain-containing protein n=1 Tax=Flemingia macrophylla TaxID=520843 RepID=A0ABD1LSI2_9FABA